MTITIASFRKRRVARAAMFLGLLGVGLFFFAYFNFRTGTVDDIFAQDALVQPIALFRLLRVILPISLGLVLLYRVVAEDGRAIWIRDGEPIYIHKCYLSARCDEIASVSKDVYGRNRIPCIILTTNNSKSKMIPTDSLAETRDLVLGRILDAVSDAKFGVREKTFRS